MDVLALLAASAFIIGGAVGLSLWEYYHYHPGLYGPLREGETFGTIVPGFVTDLDGRLVITNSPDILVYGDLVPGFVTDSAGRLVIFYAS
jgi:hypothetical protein